MEENAPISTPQSVPMHAILLTTLLATVTTGSSFEGKVVGILDADTVDVLDDSKTKHRIRLRGIDAPERGQPFAKKARDSLAALVAGKTVSVEPLGDDRYGRMIARIAVDGPAVGTAMLADGWAWHYVRYDDSDAYAAAERQAREARAGLWRDEQAVPPWEWRKLPKAERLPVQQGITADTE